MNQATILGIVRHILTALGGIAVTKGYLDESALVSGVGALVALAGVIWSIVDKRPPVA